MGQVLSAINTVLKMIKDFLHEIYKFFTVRGRLLIKLERIQRKVDDIIDDKNDLDRRLQHGHAMTHTLKDHAEELIRKIILIEHIAYDLRSELENEDNVHLYYNEDQYTQRINILEERIDEAARCVKIFLREYANVADDMLGRNDRAHAIIRVQESEERMTTAVTTHRVMRNVDVLLSS
ncbi:uncharacterized protein [Amphiura filiformis]|uniref:uncharacterized protein n=1 Tax=Amphiura filiformis TaxID=82378 RepID=UPI003B2119AF